MKQADELVEKIRKNGISINKYAFRTNPIWKDRAIQCAIISMEETVKALNEELPWADLTGNIQANHFLNESGNLIREYQQQIEYLKSKL